MWSLPHLLRRLDFNTPGEAACPAAVHSVFKHPQVLMCSYVKSTSVLSGQIRRAVRSDVDISRQQVQVCSRDLIWEE
jgi:hypothetical protein